MTRRGWLFILPAVMFALLAAGFYVGLGIDSNVLPSALIDQPAPDFTLPPLRGAEPGFASADLQGHVSLVNVFASWCTPCRAEHPVLNALAQAKRMPIYGIDYKDKHDAALAWIAELGNPYTRIGADDGRIGIDWGVYGVPETFVVDSAGRIRYKHVGPLTQADIAAHDPAARRQARAMSPLAMIRALPLAALALAVLTAGPAHAVRPDEMLADPGLEARAREVGRELRCLVCRNQSIDDFDADLAHDLRVLVRQRIVAGDSDDRVVAYVRARYGDFVLLRPPLETGTLLLWGGPFLILAFGGVALARFYRRPHGGAPPPLSADERRRLASVLGAPPPFPAPLAGEGQGGGEGGEN